MEFTRRELAGPFCLAAAMAPAGRAPGREAMRGIFIIMTTPYTAAKEVDYEDLAKQVDYLHRCGVHGMIWPQLGSEVWNLTREERLRGMEVLSRAAKGKKPALVLGVQGPNTPAAVEYLERAELLAPDALIAIPPREAKTLDEVREYYRTLAWLTKRPLIVQTTGGARGINLDAQFVASLAQEFPHCGYVKEEAPPVIERVTALAKFRPVIQRIYGGADASALLYEMRAGSDGNMPNAAYADIYARIWELYHLNYARELRSGGAAEA